MTGGAGGAGVFKRGPEVTLAETPRVITLLPPGEEFLTHPHKGTQLKPGGAWGSPRGCGNEPHGIKSIGA